MTQGWERSGEDGRKREDPPIVSIDPESSAKPNSMADFQLRLFNFMWFQTQKHQNQIREPSVGSSSHERDLGVAVDHKPNWIQPCDRWEKRYNPRRPPS